MSNLRMRKVPERKFGDGKEPPRGGLKLSTIIPLGIVAVIGLVGAATALGWIDGLGPGSALKQQEQDKAQGTLAGELDEVQAQMVEDLERAGALDEVVVGKDGSVTFVDDANLADEPGEAIPEVDFHEVDESAVEDPYMTDLTIFGGGVSFRVPTVIASDLAVEEIPETLTSLPTTAQDDCRYACSYLITYQGEGVLRLMLLPADYEEEYCQETGNTIEQKVMYDGLMVWGCTRLGGTPELNSIADAVYRGVDGTLSKMG